MTNEEREFQLEMLKTQLRHETNTALFLGIIALGYSLMVALLPVLFLAEVADFHKVGIFISLIITSIFLLYYLFQYKKHVKKIEAEIRKLEREYIKTEKKKKRLVEHSEEIKE